MVKNVRFFWLRDMKYLIRSIMKQKSHDFNKQLKTAKHQNYLSSFDDAKSIQTKYSDNVE
jgi:hypothetical protein